MSLYCFSIAFDESTEHGSIFNIYTWNRQSEFNIYEELADICEVTTTGDDII